MYSKSFCIVVAFLVFLTCLNSTFAQEATPKADASKTETPKTETPKTETPKSGAPKAKTSKTETPQSEVPKTETPKAETPKPDVPFTNKDVLELAGDKWNDSVIIAKINAAKLVSFKVENDDLKALRKAGVSQEVITAMINRSATLIAPSGGSSRVPARGAIAPSSGEDMLVRLVTKEKTTDLASVAGHASATSTFWSAVMFMNYPNLKAEVRTQDQKPYLVVQSGKNPQGRIFLVHCDLDKDDNRRSVKMGKSGLFSGGEYDAPDSDEEWTVPVDIKNIEQGLWRLDPKKDLNPGEYGIYVRSGELFDFGVDK